METRQETYSRKRLELSKKCEVCRHSKYPPSPERCDECHTGWKLRMLETEYGDVTGCSHTKW